MSIDHYRTVPINNDVQAVIVGLDTKFNYHKLAMANLHLQAGGTRTPAKFIATNADAYDMVAGFLMPGAGALVNAILTSLNNENGSQRTDYPEVTGKPNPFAVDLILRDNGMDMKDEAVRSRMIMIGDRLDTDIKFGANAGIDTCLVLTGCTRSTEHA
jgi:HAD superfamily hydrolase (TIGR01450 family)